jgi:hypothetical protein
MLIKIADFLSEEVDRPSAIYDRYGTFDIVVLGVIVGGITFL